MLTIAAREAKNSFGHLMEQERLETEILRMENEIVLRISGSPTVTKKVSN